MSAITFQTIGTAAANTSAGTTLAVPYPANVALGESLLVGVLVSSATLPTNPTGWTSLQTNTAGGSSPSMRVSIIAATSTEVTASAASGSLNVTTPNGTSQGWMLRMPGVHQTNPTGGVTPTVYSNSAASAAYDLPTLTTDRPGWALVYFAAGNTAAGTFTPPSVPVAFTEDRDIVTATPKATSGHLIWASSGSTGTVNLVSSSSVRGGGILVALQPQSVVSSRATTWTAKASVVSSRATTWNTKVAVASTRATTWNTKAAVAPSRATTWRALASVAPTRATTWRVEASIVATRSTTWRVLKAVPLTRATTWNADGQVVVSRATAWRTISAIPASRPTTWDVLKTVSKNQSTTWNVFYAPPRDLTLTGGRVAPRLVGAQIKPRISGQREP